MCGDNNGLDHHISRYSEFCYYILTGTIHATLLTAQTEISPCLSPYCSELRFGRGFTALLVAIQPQVQLRLCGSGHWIGLN